MPDASVYEPPALVARLVVGARVQVRISGECNVCRWRMQVVGIDWDDAHGGGSELRYQDLADRKTGTIRHIHNDGLLNGHRFFVELDEPIEMTHGSLVGVIAAAIELEPINA